VAHQIETAPWHLRLAAQSCRYESLRADERSGGVASKHAEDFLAADADDKLERLAAEHDDQPHLEGKPWPRGLGARLLMGTKFA
jgi:hypothetical protein